METIVSWTVHECITCHMLFAVPQQVDARYRETHEWFKCPSGHSQAYPGKTDKERRIDSLTADVKRLTSSLNCKRTMVKRLEYEKRHWKGEVTKLKKGKA